MKSKPIKVKGVNMKFYYATFRNYLGDIIQTDIVVGAEISECKEYASCNGLTVEFEFIRGV